LYPTERLDPDTYQRVKAAGFIWAPKQELFVAPMWTPARADLLAELCGDIGDEDTSLVDRAEERAERFQDYSESRANDAEQAREAVSAIADNIPLGQPILVGHHSEKHARKDAEKIRNGMTRAVKMWEQAQYWRSRATGAIRAAKYKERPDVRARRIKGLEADQRKQQKEKAALEKLLKFWQQESITQERAEVVCNYFDHNGITLANGEREWSAWSALHDGKATVDYVRAERLESLPPMIAYHDRWLGHIGNRLEYERAMLAESGGTAADRNKPEVGGAVRCWCSPGYGKGWAYVRKVNKVSVSVLDNWGNGGANFTRTIPFDKLSGIMSAAAVQEERESGRLLESASKQGFYLQEPDPTPQLASISAAEQLEQDAAALEKETEALLAEVSPKSPPAVAEAEKEGEGATQGAKARGPWDVLRQATFDPGSVQINGRLERSLYLQVNKLLESAGGVWNRKRGAHVFRQNPATLFDLENEKVLGQAASFETIKAALAAGVQTVVAPQLFPTPPDLARRMADEAGLLAGKSVLEPSAGTGNLIRAIQNNATGFDCNLRVCAVEINPTLAEGLKAQRNRTLYANEGNFAVVCADFLTVEPPRLGNCDLIIKQLPIAFFDAVIMNPPFVNGQDIAHIKHALKFLTTGGKLVALCANGPRQNDQLRSMVEANGGLWEVLPPDTFKESGTGVNAVLLTMTAQ
jgi:predicted RNA methylase